MFHGDLYDLSFDRKTYYIYMIYSYIASYQQQPPRKTKIINISTLWFVNVCYVEAKQASDSQLTRLTFLFSQRWLKKNS